MVAQYVRFLLKSCQKFQDFFILGNFSVVLTWPVQIRLETMYSRGTFLLLTNDTSLKSRDKITLSQTRRTVPLQTLQDAFGNGSSPFAFGFTGFGIPAAECYFYSSRYDSHISCWKAVYWCFAKQLKQTLCFKLFHCSFAIMRKLRDFIESFFLVMYIPGIKHFHKDPRTLFPLFKY